MIIILASLGKFRMSCLYPATGIELRSQTFARGSSLPLMGLQKAFSPSILYLNLFSLSKEYFHYFLKSFVCFDIYPLFLPDPFLPYLPNFVSHFFFKSYQVWFILSIYPWIYGWLSSGYTLRTINDSPFSSCSPLPVVPWLAVEVCVYLLKI